MACATKETSACLCTSCLNGCTSCSGGCSGDCDGSCSGDCRGCRGDCSSTCRGCSGCSGSCSGNCNGCSGSCQGSCQNSCSASCTGTCTNSCTSCTGTCTGGCQTNCTGQCDNACTGENQAELIAHLGDNIGIGKIIMASDYTEIKNAMENEYRRRGMELPQPFEKQPIPGEPVILSITKEVLTDIYEFDKAPEHDWRELFSKWELAAAPKWAPVLSHIKTLMTSIAVNVNAVSEE
ncbi:MAG: hypothetical protein KH509_06320 [Clostridium sp.]|nr:hypothetical protein [Clostridium sp.]